MEEKSTPKKDDLKSGDEEMKDNKDTKKITTGKKKVSKQRSDKYEEKVSFDGTFDELLKLTVTPGKNKESKKKK